MENHKIEISTNEYEILIDEKPLDLQYCESITIVLSRAKIEVLSNMHRVISLV